jgi:putative flippase GtrA
MAIKKTIDDHREAFLYLVFGAFTVLVSWASYAVFVWIGLELNVSNILSWVCAVLFAFVVNKWFVFENRSKEPSVVIKELGSFVSARIFTGIVAFVLFPVLLAVGMDGGLFGIEGFPARIVTSLVEIALNWIFSKYMIFTKKTAKKDAKNCERDDDELM